VGERSLVFVLAAIQFTHVMDFMIMMPLGPQLMRVMLISPQQFGLLVSAYTLTAAVAALAVAFYNRPLRSPQNADLSLRGLRDLDSAVRNRAGLWRAAGRARGRRRLRRRGRCDRTLHHRRRDSRTTSRRGDRMIMSAFAAVLPSSRADRIVSCRAILLARAVPVARRRLDAGSDSHLENSSPHARHIFEGQSHRPLEQMKAVFGTANHLRASYSCSR